MWIVRQPDRRTYRQRYLAKRDNFRFKMFLLKLAWRNNKWSEQTRVIVFCLLLCLVKWWSYYAFGFWWGVLN